MGLTGLTPRPRPPAPRANGCPPPRAVVIMTSGGLYPNAAYLRSGQAGGVDGDLVCGGAGEAGPGGAPCGGAGAGEPGVAAAAAGREELGEGFGADADARAGGGEGAADGAQGDGVGDPVGVEAAGGGGLGAGGAGELAGA